MFIDVLNPGFLTTVQDLGRWKGVHMGIPVSGVMDPFAAMAANTLVGNESDAAVLEMTLLGPTLLFEQSQIIAIAGADLGPRIDGCDIENWKSHVVKSGSILEFSGHRSGARAYMAVSGGIQVEPWLGSRSTYLAGAVGGFQGRALRQTDRLAVGPPCFPLLSAAGSFLRPDHRPQYQSNPPIRVILGPHAGQFTKDGIRTLLSEDFRVSNDSNRMGYRLEGPAITHVNGADTSSCGIPLGGIQVPGNGQPIVLMADHQVTGGYAMIASVIQADIPLLAQCMPGQSVSFHEVTLHEARESINRQLSFLHQLAEELVQTLWSV